MPDGEQKVAEAVREVLNPSDIASMGNTVGTQWMQVPEWGNKWVCVWGTTLPHRVRIEADAALAETDAAQALRRQVAGIIECVKDGDGLDAKPIFERAAHWGWLEKQPVSVLDALWLTIRVLDMGGGAVEELFGGKALQEQLTEIKSCLSFIGSHCGACTDCPKKSTCPLQPSTEPSQPTE